MCATTRASAVASAPSLTCSPSTSEEVIEKNYVLGWMLWGIGGDPVLGDQWVFKGGTCLKKCYIETTGSPKSPR